MHKYLKTLHTICLKERINMRLDLYLTENNYCESRNKASETIKNGMVFVDGKNVMKPSFEVNDFSKIEIIGEFCRYVGRGGLKLECAIKAFSLDFNGKICADIGASTGGFTDCMLQNGAKKVYAVDSGKNQLHKKLREDKRVVCMEGVNARYISRDILNDECDIVTMDVSFISQTLLYSAVTNILKDKGVFVSLIKPQFEAGKNAVGKNGIVKDKKIHTEVCKKIIEEAEKYGLKNISVTESSILGSDGNKEFLALFRYNKINLKEENL